ncbi:TIGR03915 family putative DNA repair protein [Ottowia thiooxydans]
MKPWTIELPSSDAWESFRQAARHLLTCHVPWDSIHWTYPGRGKSDTSASLLLDDGMSTAIAAERLVDYFPAQDSLRNGLGPGVGSPLRIPRSAMDICACASLHQHPHRYELIYRWLQRCQWGEIDAADALDADWRRIEKMKIAVAHEIHRMHAFVRFQPLQRGDGLPDLHVAWFEPDHHIIRAVAPFFTKRFPNMHWMILAPELGLHWNTSELTESTGNTQASLPPPDAGAELWLAYYRSTFNPNRLKASALTQKMPRRYWKNLPEAALIEGLIHGAERQ